MKLEEEFVGRTAHFAELLRTVADRLEAEHFTIRGLPVALPDADMEYKISYKRDAGGYKLTIGIEWIGE
ncbi:amphi-Trp domain-containing protein [Paenibacillus sp.]|uniref:amphi-Trp domain-containing protein n=1 Tax=Paenibacillus sp. TaxID=58172 RepID=UPI002D23B61D|nr:amphi-Trp domain-containing protein [Paenibacillus sp.]HZG84335.1 amphi-Trp domain-containing protein [Paenibacillus sp.]